ncbi:MAG: hypothetical protein IKR21_01000, partial [Oscillospiraceae bacterium]|nr:hypothetical protein [Oscillospiraceae bacterium]
MKKLMIRALFLLAFFCIFALPTKALDTEAAERAVPEAAREIIGGASVGDEGLFEKIAGRAGDMFLYSLRSAAGTGTAVFAIAAVCSFVSAGYPGEKAPAYVSAAGALAIAAVTLGRVSSFTAMASQTLGDLSVFSGAILPCLASASVFAGETASAAAKYAASSFFMSVLITLSDRIVMPFIGAFLAASVADAAVGGGALKAAVGCIKWLTVTVLTGVTLAFVVTIAVTGTVSGTADAVALRLARTAMSTALPVVGGIISDAAGSVLAGAAAMRSAFGVFGLAVIAAVCLEPVMRLGAYLLIFKAAGAAAGP